MTAPSGGTQPEPLQFDSAEQAPGAAAGVTCANCQRGITTTYHMLNDRVICSPCRGRLEREFGTGAGRMGAAALHGLGGGAVGAVIYYAVLATTGYQVGLIAILVGWLVGRGVHKGSGGRGGWHYQALAVGLTYFSIVSTYVPLVVKDFKERAASERVAADSARAAGQLDTAQAISTYSKPTDAASVEAADSLAGAAGDSATALHHLTTKQWMLGLGAMLLLALILPFLVGGVIGMLIVGFALYQAWKMNKRVPIAFTGPFRVGPAPA